MNDPAIDALAYVHDEGILPPLASGDVLFLRARDGALLDRHGHAGWVCEQSFKPFADRLAARHLHVEPVTPARRFARVLLLPPRQRDEARALFARAVHHAQPGATILAAQANNEGARSGETDLGALIGPLRSLSKHKCRVYGRELDPDHVDAELLAAWMALDAVQPIGVDDLLSRPGLFAWDRVDAGSGLLARHLPDDIGGRVADLGAGYGYLARELLRHCPGIQHIDLYEAEARALPAAEANLAAWRERVGIGLHWHDVGAGLPHRYDAIVSNPPFHTGRADQPDLGRAFIRSAAAALQRSGTFWLVANRHLPYETTLREHFGEVDILADESGYKVIRAGKVIA